MPRRTPSTSGTTSPSAPSRSPRRHQAAQEVVQVAYRETVKMLHGPARRAGRDARRRSSRSTRSSGSRSPDHWDKIRTGSESEFFLVPSGGGDDTVPTRPHQPVRLATVHLPTLGVGAVLVAAWAGPSCPGSTGPTPPLALLPCSLGLPRDRRTVARCGSATAPRGPHPRRLRRRRPRRARRGPRRLRLPHGEAGGPRLSPS